MKSEVDYKKTGEVLMELYGAVKGMQINATAIPNIIKDFESMLKKAPTGSLVTETYQFDDIAGKVQLSGSNQVITAMDICGKKII